MSITKQNRVERLFRAWARYWDTSWSMTVTAWYRPWPCPPAQLTLSTFTA